jgi:hypothetical protein
MSTKAIDLFVPIVSKENAHIAFERLRESSSHWGARLLMNELFGRMGDVDGNFVQDFQSHGFHSRLFELACYAYLEAQALEIKRAFRSPDFLVERQGFGSVGVEAVTTNPASGRNTDIALFKMEPPVWEEIVDKASNEIAIRIGSALLSKLKKRYWELPHCKNIPLVLLVGPFHEPGSVTYVDESLASYLYGTQRFPDWTEHNGLFVREAPVRTHEFNGKSIPSNFFAQKSAEYVSAVIYCNQFTVPRFYRMAAQAGRIPDEDIAIDIRGLCLIPGQDHNVVHNYKYDLRDPDAPEETWWRGVTVFHNPDAKYPLPDDVFACTSSFRYHNGRLEREVYDLHTLTSFMQVIVKGQ